MGIKEMVTKTLIPEQIFLVSDTRIEERCVENGC